MRARPPLWCCGGIAHPLWWQIIISALFVSHYGLIEILSSFSNSCTVLPYNDDGIRPFNAAFNSFNACTNASSGDTMGFVMCLCFKNTVSEIRSAPVCLLHTSKNL